METVLIWIKVLTYQGFDCVTTSESKHICKKVEGVETTLVDVQHWKGSTDGHLKADCFDAFTGKKDGRILSTLTCFDQTLVNGEVWNVQRKYFVEKPYEPWNSRVYGSSEGEDYIPDWESNFKPNNSN